MDVTAAAVVGSASCGANGMVSVNQSVRHTPVVVVVVYIYIPRARMCSSGGVSNERTPSMNELRTHASDSINR